MSPARRAARAAFRSLRVRNYRLYFTAQVISVSGTWMQSFAQGWLVLRLTHSGVALGSVTALQFVPMLVAGPWGGLVADRSDRRRVLYVTQSAAGLLALALGLLTLLRAVTLWEVYLLAFGLGIVNVVDNPARQSFVVEMVGRDDLPNAVSLNSVVMNASRVIGPAVAGIVIEVAGLAVCFLANSVSYAAVIVGLVLMRRSEMVARHVPVGRAKGQLREGMRYVRRSPDLLVPLLAMAVVGTLAYNFQVTLLLFARGTFRLGPGGSGAMFSFMGAGAVAGGLAMAARRKPSMRALMYAAGAFGLAMLAVAAAPSHVVAWVLLVPMGAASIAFVVLANSILQLRAAPEMRGRVMALYAMAFLGSTPVGAIAVGALAQWTNPRVAIAAGGISAVTVAAAILARRSRHPEQIPAEPAIAAELSALPPVDQEDEVLPAPAASAPAAPAPAAFGSLGRPSTRSATMLR